jgi:cysteine desulfurase
VPGSILIGDSRNRLPNTLNIAFADIEAESILLMLDRARIAASSGSACSTGSMEPSHVLRAMKVPFRHLRGALRFSFSRENTDSDVDRVLEVLPQAVRELQSNFFPMEAACD